MSGMQGSLFNLFCVDAGRISGSLEFWRFAASEGLGSDGMGPDGFGSV